MLPLVTAANFPDVLLLLVNQATFRRCLAVEKLLQHDKEHLRVLHSQPNSNNDSKEGGRSTSGQPAQPRDQQWQAEFVSHLLEMCVLYDLGSVCLALAALPAAQHISECAAGLVEDMELCLFRFVARSMHTQSFILPVRALLLACLCTCVPYSCTAAAA